MKGEHGKVGIVNCAVMVAVVLGLMTAWGVLTDGPKHTMLTPTQISYMQEGAR